MSLNLKTFQKCQRIAAKCREATQFDKRGGISARSKNDVGSLYIYSVIGSSWFEEGVTAEGVRNALEGLKGVKTLNIFINSEGGDVFEAKAIYTQLKRFNAHKVVHVDGIAASAATFIAMAADRIITSPAATWMVHEAWTIAMGDAAALRDSADLLEMLNEDIANIYAERTKRTHDEMRELMAAETWMNADQALAAKFTDEIAVFSEDDEEETNEKNQKTTRVAALAETTSQRIAAMTSDLLQFRAKRATNQAITTTNPPKQETKDGRTSAAKRTPASR